MTMRCRRCRAWRMWVPAKRRRRAAVGRPTAWATPPPGTLAAWAPARRAGAAVAAPRAMKRASPKWQADRLRPAHWTGSASHAREADPVPISEVEAVALRAGVSHRCPVLARQARQIRAQRRPVVGAEMT